MRNRAKKEWDNFLIDSDEEYLFLCWFEEAESLGLVGNLTIQPSFLLTPRQSVQVPAPTKRNPDKMKDQFLFHPHNYKADFSFDVVLHSGKDNIFSPLLNKFGSNKKDDIRYGYEEERPTCIVDIKGGWANHRSRNSSDVTFPLNQKFVYDKYGVYVNKVVISPGKGFFKNFWAPDEAFVTEKGNPSIRYKGCCRFDYIKENANKIITQK